MESALTESRAWAAAQTVVERLHFDISTHSGHVLVGEWCQIDGAWKATECRAGLGLYNFDPDSGSTLVGASTIRRGLSPLQMELEALVWAMQSMLAHNKQQINFQTDCVQLVKMVSKPAEWPVFEILLDEMEKCRRMFQTFSLTHIPRTENTKADKLARSARDQPHNVYYINSIPPVSLPERSCTAPKAELWGLYYGLCIAWEKGITRLEIEVDSALVVGFMKTGINDTHPLSFLVHLCHGFLLKDWEVRITHVYREANRLADGLTNYAFSLALGTGIGEVSRGTRVDESEEDSFYDRKMVKQRTHWRLRNRSIDSTWLPSRIFAAGDEPVGDRVNSYFKLSSIGAVLRYLQPSEIEQICPAFGKLLDAYSKQAYSGKLAHFLLTRQLVVNKNHEIWVVFSGKPIRFSLREFGFVTGLKCSPLPVVPAERMKSNPGVVPYWFTLFGGEPFVTREMLLSRLKRSRDLSSEVRVKYACLILVDGMLCRRSSTMKIPKEHVEMIRDLDYFLDYPWGRICFDMTIRCIRTRQTNQLAQPTVAIQGFIHTLQLVLLEAVPSAVAAVGDGTDTESGEEDTAMVTALKLDKIWELDSDDTVPVTSIIRMGDDSVVGDCSWVDELEDPQVDYMVEQIDEGALFNKDHFRGGRSRTLDPVQPVPTTASTGKRKGKAHVETASPVKVAKRGKRSSKRSKAESHKQGESTITMDMVAGHVKDALSLIEKSIMDSLQAGLKEVEGRLLFGIDSAITKKIDEHWKTKDADAAIGSVLRDIANEKENSIQNHATQEAPVEETNVIVSTNPANFAKKKFNAIVANPIPSRETLFTNGGGTERRADIMPSSFPFMLAKHHSRFKKLTKKESFEFNEEILEYNRWVAVVVDLASSSVTVFDPHAKAVRGSRLKPEFNFLCEILPYFIKKAASCEDMESFKLTTFSFSRDIQVAQVDDRGQTGIMAVMFIEFHASRGLVSVYTVSEDKIGERAENLAVEMFEFCCGDIDLDD
ncbi:unnamed protein product [Microthlaspi erraticum]|uniref:RNase H type-1 domain-containing protein n=1 Tax=Microthlaspi erraticum TaxID=1685480 RepID=A0A6D2KF10_9BRAS|nr:unnamed protein product [Microthlaspi erraticum]